MVENPDALCCEPCRVTGGAVGLILISIAAGSSGDGDGRSVTDAILANGIISRFLDRPPPLLTK